MNNGYVIPPLLATALISGTVHVSRELLDEAQSTRSLFMDMLTAPPLSPEQIAQLQREQAEQRAAQQAANNASWQRLADAGGLIAAIAELHRPDSYGDCFSCGGGEETCDWPCDTAQTLINHLETHS